jgi:hypothetical protein
MIPAGEIFENDGTGNGYGDVMDAGGEMQRN